MNLNPSFKKYLSLSICLSQVLSSFSVSLSAADLRPRNHIQPLRNSTFAPTMGTSANGTDVVNILDPNAQGISHNKYQSFDITKDGGVILNNSLHDGVSVTGGYVSANPNLSSGARLIINEILSSKSTSLQGSLEVFGKSADVIIANENGLIVNGASFINTTGVTLSTGLIDSKNGEILVRQGNVSILGGGVGVDGDYFSIISRSMQLSGNISNLHGKPLAKINFIAGANDVSLKADMQDVEVTKSIQSSENKPKISIDGNILGSMYAGYIHFLSTEEGVGVRHLGVIRSASDIIIDTKGEISTAALIAQNIDVKTSQNLNNQGVLIADKNLKITAQTLQNTKAADKAVMDKLGLELKTAYIQAENVDLKSSHLLNAGKIIALKGFDADFLGDSFRFENSGNIAATDSKIQASSFQNSGLFSSDDLMLNAQNLANTGEMYADSLKARAMEFSNDGKIQSNNLQLTAQTLTNKSNIQVFDGEFNIQKIQNSGNIESKNQLFLNFGDVSKNLSTFLDNSGTFKSDNILGLKAGDVDIDSSFKDISAGGVLAIESMGDISVKKDFISIGSINLSAKGNISNAANTLLASSGDVYLNAKAFLNEDGAYVFGKNIRVVADSITNNQNSTIDSQSTMFLKADTINNNLGVINSGEDMKLSVKTLNNNGQTSGAIDFQSTGIGWLHYYFAKDYFGNRNFDASFVGYNITNNLQNQQALIKSGGTLAISSEDEKLADVYNANSTIAAAKNINIIGNVYNTTTEQEYSVQDLLKKFKIERIQATPTYLGNSGVYNLGSGNPLEVLDKAKYSSDDNAGYFGLLQDLSSKSQLFKSLMARGFGVDWLVRNPANLTLDTNAKLSFTPKNPAQILAGNDINITAGAVYNSTNSIQKIHSDISNINASIKDIQDLGISGQSSQNNADSNKPNGDKPTKPTKDPKDSKDEILHSAGLSDEEILGLGKQLLFHISNDKLNSKINYYIETRENLVDMSKFYGSEYFFNQIGYAPAKPISVIGDAYYENRLLNEQLTQNLGYSNALNSDDIKNLLDNAVLEGKALGLVVGEGLKEEQIEKLDKDIVWYVNKKINGRDVLVPQIYYSKNTSLQKLPSSDSSSIAASGNLFLDVGTLENQSSDLQAKGLININAKKDVKNIGGGIAGGAININAKSFLSQSKLDIDKSGNLQNTHEAKLVSKTDVNIQTQENIKIQNSVIASSAEDSQINLISKGGLIEISDDVTKKTSYQAQNKQTADSSWIGTTITSTSSSSGSKIFGDNINFKSAEGIIIKGSSLVQNAKDGNINLSSDGNISILAGAQDDDIRMQTSFSGVNESGMREYSSLTNATQKLHQAIGSTAFAMGNIHIQTSKALKIQSSGLRANKQIFLQAQEGAMILDSQNTSASNSSNTSYQVFGIKGTKQSQSSSFSAGSSIKAGEGMVIDSKKGIDIISSSLDGGSGDVVLNAKENLKIQAGKNTSSTQSTSYGFGITGSASVGVMGSELSAKFGLDEQQAQAKSNFDPKTLTSGKIQMDSLASSDVGLEFSYNTSNNHNVQYSSSSIKTAGSIKANVTDEADIGGGNFDAGKDIALKASAIKTTKYMNEDSTNSLGFNLSIKQRGQITSSALDSMNMISDVATKAAQGQDVNAGIVTAGAIGAVTNLVFNDLAGALSTQEGSFQMSYQNSHTTSENITKLNAGGNISMQSTQGDISLSGVSLSSDSLNLDGAKNINIAAAKNTQSESGFSFGIDGRYQQSAGYSALWGNNADMGVGGSLNASYHEANSISYQTSNFEIKNNAQIISNGDTNIIGGRINAGNAHVDVGGNLNIASAIDTTNSKSFNANLGADVSLGVASSTIGKGNVSLNAGGGYYGENSQNIAIQSGISTLGKLDVNVKGNAELKGAILSSSTQKGGFEVGGRLDISDLDSYSQKSGGSLNLSGGLSGNFGGRINIGDYEKQKGKLHSAINIATNSKDGIFVGGAEVLAKDIYSDTQNTKEILSSTSFAGGDISFSVDTNKIKEMLGSQSHAPRPDKNDEEKAGHFSIDDFAMKNNADYAKTTDTNADGELLETFHISYESQPTQPNLMPNEPTPPPIPTPTPSQEANPQNLSLAAKIKNFFSKNKGSYDLKDETSHAKDPQALSYKTIYDDLPPKSQDTLSEQALIKHENDLIKFAAMGEELPPRVPIKTEKKTSQSDVQDFEDLMDRGVFGAQDLNISQSADILNSIAKNPIFRNHFQEDSLRHYFVELLSAVGDNFPYHPDSRDYKELRGKIHDYVDDRVMNNPKIEEYVKNFDPTNQKHFEKIAKEVIKDYTQAMKDAGLTTTDTKVYFSKDNENAFYWRHTEGVHFPTPEVYKEHYFKYTDPTNEEFALHVLNTSVHEMTHKQQGVFVNNMDNPIFSQTIKDYASIIDLNFRIYAKGKKDGFDLYRGQILEKEAFDHGDNMMKKFSTFLERKSSEPTQGDLGNSGNIGSSGNPHNSSTPSNLRKNVNSILNAISNVFSSRGVPEDANSMMQNPNENSIEIKHLPTISKNLESTLEGEADFSNVALVYGLSSNRRILLQGVPETEMKKRPLIADDYLQALNAADSPEKERRFYDFAKSIAIGNEDLLKNTILNYKEVVGNPRDEGINAIPRKDNQRVFEDLLGNEETKKIIKNIDANKNAMEAIEQVAKQGDMKELNSFLTHSIGDISKLSTEEKRLYQLYMQYATALDEERFFGAKTISVLQNVLDSGGKIYFNLDGLVTNYYPYTDRVKDVDLKKLQNVFDKNDEYYESITAEELRYVYQNLREHPNLKFTIKKQVIENPFQFQDVTDAIDSKLKTK